MVDEQNDGNDLDFCGVSECERLVAVAGWRQVGGGYRGSGENVVLLCKRLNVADDAAGLFGCASDCLHGVDQFTEGEDGAAVRIDDHRNRCGFFVRVGLQLDARPRKLDGFAVFVAMVMTMATFVQVVMFVVMIVAPARAVGTVVVRVAMLVVVVVVVRVAMTMVVVVAPARAVGTMVVRVVVHAFVRHAIHLLSRRGRRRSWAKARSHARWGRLRSSRVR